MVGPFQYDRSDMQRREENKTTEQLRIEFVEAQSTPANALWALWGSGGLDDILNDDKEREGKSEESH